MKVENLTQIPKFHRINDWLYRGGQPAAADVIALKELGIKTVVSLRWTASIVEAEREMVEAAGLNFIAIPLTYWIFPTNAEIDKFLAVCDDPSMHPVFLHCKYGVDRTGVFVAIYRMARENWPARKAYQEMRDAGFHKIRMHQFKWAVFLYGRKLERELEKKRQTGTRRDEN